MDRRTAMTHAVGALGVVAAGAALAAADEPAKEETRSAGATRCLVSLQMQDLPSDFFKEEAKVREYFEKLAPFIAQELGRCVQLPRTRGCTVSGSVSGTSSGGFGGSATITCTL